MMSGPCNTWGSITMYRFSEDIIIIHIRQLLFDNIYVHLICYHIYILVWQYLCEPVKSLLKGSATRTKEINKLFRQIFTAARPQTASQASCQYHTIIILYIYHFIDLIRF